MEVECWQVRGEQEEQSEPAHPPLGAAIGQTLQLQEGLGQHWTLLQVHHHRHNVDVDESEHFRQHSELVQASLAATLWKTLANVNVFLQV